MSVVVGLRSNSCRNWNSVFRDGSALNFVGSRNRVQQIKVREFRIDVDVMTKRRRGKHNQEHATMNSCGHVQHLI